MIILLIITDEHKADGCSSKTDLSGIELLQFVFVLVVEVEVLDFPPFWIKLK